MINLAGNADCDRFIRKELERARIPAMETHRAAGEVAFSVMGILGPFSFQRAWYYWVARGPVPLDVARELYTDPVGKEDVRSGGDCACRPPEGWADYFDVDDKLLAINNNGTARDQYLDMIQRGLLRQEDFDRLHYVDTKEDRQRLAVRAIVNTYHIDSEVGLRLFADTLRKYRLDAQ